MAVSTLQLVNQVITSTLRAALSLAMLPTLGSPALALFVSPPSKTPCAVKGKTHARPCKCPTRHRAHAPHRDEATAPAPSPAPPPPSPPPPPVGVSTSDPSLPKWEEPILKGIAAAAMSIVSFGFAAFTFLYGTLLKLEGTSPRIVSLKRTLRIALYGTAIAVVLAAIQAGLAFVSVAFYNSALGYCVIGLASVILLMLCSVTGYLAWDVFRGGKASS